MASEYYIIMTEGRDRRAFKTHAKTRATKQVGHVVHRFSLDKSLAIVKVEQGTSISDLGRSRGPINAAQARQFIQSNLADWEEPER